MPWVTFHYPEFRKLKLPWEWHVIDGLAEQEHGHVGGYGSTDGTKEYFRDMKWDNRVQFHNLLNVASMAFTMNVPMGSISAETLVFKVDCDEIWTADQIHEIHAMFSENPSKNHALFWCNYYIGPKVIVTTRNAWGNKSGEWPRVWRVNPGARWFAETPPIIEGMVLNAFTQDQTERRGLVFDHYAYVLESQAREKDVRYHQTGTYEGWLRLQKNTQWPVRLKNFFPWVEPEVMADCIR